MVNLLTQQGNSIIRSLYRTVAAACGAVAGYFEPVVPFVLLTTLFVLVDCWSAWRLSRRVRELHPGANDGKFKSKDAGKVIHTLLMIYACTILAFLSDTLLFPSTNLHLANMVTAAFCFTQAVSILENESSCNHSTWAKLLQKILVDKAERHFDVNLDEFKNKGEATSAISQSSASIENQNKEAQTESESQADNDI